MCKILKTEVEIKLDRGIPILTDLDDSCQHSQSIAISMTTTLSLPNGDNKKYPQILKSGDIF